MASWRLTGRPEDRRSDRWRDLPRPRMAGMEGGAGYIPHDALVDAINVALALGQPLLVTGEPGCGKTELASYITYELGLDEPIRFVAKSTMTARDLFYHFDMVGYFGAAQVRRHPDGTRRPNRREDAGGDDFLRPVDFLHFQALGAAIVRANEPATVAHLIGADLRHATRRRSVVLIDEIDKAPRDIANDLLTELERMTFRIPELGAEIAADAEMQPILVLTSNSEKVLPDAFLRRCVFYDMPFPAADTLKEIAAARLTDLPQDSGLLEQVIRLFEFVRDRHHRLRKPPGTAELLGFLAELLDRGFSPEDGLPKEGDWRRAASVTLFKTREDQERAIAILDLFFERPAASAAA